MYREGIYPHYGFEQFEKFYTASNYKFYRLTYFEKMIKSAPRISVIILAQMAGQQPVKQVLEALVLIGEHDRLLQGSLAST